MKPISTLFRTVAAGLCLVNEWRDSLSYFTLGVVAGNAVLQGYPVPLVGEFVLCAATCREAVRTVSWLFHQHPVIADDQTPKIDPALARAAAGVVTVTSAALGILVIATSDLGFRPSPVIPKIGTPTSLIGLAYYTFCLKQLNKSAKDIPAIYAAIWDWPRKRDGDGGTTLKMRKSLSAWAGTFSKHRPPAHACAAKLAGPTHG